MSRAIPRGGVQLGSVAGSKAVVSRTSHRLLTCGIARLVQRQMLPSLSSDNKAELPGRGARQVLIEGAPIELGLEDAIDQILEDRLKAQSRHYHVE